MFNELVFQRHSPIEAFPNGIFRTVAHHRVPMASRGTAAIADLLISV